MKYYEVRPATNRYYGESLTYCWPEKLEMGQVVKIKVRNLSCLAIVKAEVKKPEFKTNPIEDEIDSLALTRQQEKLYEWIQDYYPGSESALASLFAPSYLSRYANKRKVLSSPTKDLETIQPPLTNAQSETYQKIAQQDGTIILNGVTGSGKTRIYMELARDQIRQGKSVLVLTPEIALTAPLEQQFKNIFGDIVLTNHSNLTQLQKSKLHGTIYKSNKPLIVLGPRSCLFLPFNKLGLIIIDEFHETSYKQDSSPRYQTNRVAGKLAEITESKLLFGSATPPVNDYYLAEYKNRTILNINTSAITHKKPEINEIVVDLSDKNEQTSYPLLS